MSKKQIKISNFIYSFFFLPICLTLAKEAFSQEKKQDLFIADSLFEQRKYTESFNIYQSILNKEKQTTPRMFLRMAFIKEGLGDYSKALYYLNEYYLKTSDKNAQNKMEEIANANNLKGFDISDKTFFIRQLRTSYKEITIGVFVFALFILVIIFYKKYKLQQKPIISGILLVIFLSVLFYLINFGYKTNEGIIIENYTYIMAGPSAGASLIEVVKNGHKVKIMEEGEVWTTIEWNGYKGFIKKNKIMKFD